MISLISSTVSDILRYKSRDNFSAMFRRGSWTEITLCTRFHFSKSKFFVGLSREANVMVIGTFQFTNLSIMKSCEFHRMEPSWIKANRGKSICVCTSFSLCSPRLLHLKCEGKAQQFEKIFSRTVFYLIVSCADRLCMDNTLMIVLQNVLGSYLSDIFCIICNCCHCFVHVIVLLEKFKDCFGNIFHLV